MADPFGGWGGGDLDGTRRRDGDDDDAAAGGQLLVGGHRQVFHDAVLQFQVDLAGAGAAAGHGQVDGAGQSDGPVDAQRAVGAEPAQGAHEPGDDGQRRYSGGEGDAQGRRRLQPAAGG